MNELLDFDSLKLTLASTENIKTWSFGEITKPETINYRTLKPEKDGLFDERIFGPTKDWECYCGKYKRIRYRGIICDKCGVEVTHSRVRRERMGHIQLAAPVVHNWFFKGTPSRLGLLLDVSPRNLDAVIYFASYLAIDIDEEKKKSVLSELANQLDKKRKEQADLLKKRLEEEEKGGKKEVAAIKSKAKSGEHLDLKIEEAQLNVRARQAKLREESVQETSRLEEIYKNISDMVSSIKPMDLLSEEEYLKLADYNAGEFLNVGMGAEAVISILEKVDLAKLAVSLREEITKSAGQRHLKATRKLRLEKNMRKAEILPSWMIIKVLPVLPPDLRPMVQLSGGRFATSDLNDLYRRVINRNNRLKKLIELGAPEIILRNEKRMLQEAVDALFDNGRHGHPVMGAGNRPLKSLSEMLKGKQGRFRQNLLGKRVDYSGRSVIVVGPDLKFNQCGLPKKMALELFEPFIVKRLKDLGYVYTIRSAKKMIQKQDPEVWDVLEEIIKGHPVLLNRAPTLHRLGIQAFEPVLIEGKAIRIHPLVTQAFNADFDGDQMAVHIPLSIEAQLEAKLLMMAPDNIFLPSSGRPVAVPSQDMILGLYYLMHDPVIFPDKEGRKIKTFANPEEVLMALNSSGSYSWYEKQDPKMKRTDHLGRGLPIHEKIRVLIDGGVIETPPGRVLFNTIVPKQLGFQNYVLRKKRLSELVLECYKKIGLEATVQFLDNMKNLGFREATKAALSMGTCDVKIPPSKGKELEEAYKRVAIVKKQYEDGIITEGERHSKIISIWTDVSDRLSAELFELVYDTTSGELNPLYLMVDSGARGTKSQVKQLGALRGLMARPSGEIIESPITANFREGLTVMEYFISTHGARKGLSDTALKTADSGYLTRRLVDVAQDVIISEHDCGTLNGIVVEAIIEAEEEVVPLKERVVGRVAVDNIVDIITDEIIVEAGSDITAEAAQRIETAGIEKIRIRSVLTC